VAEILRKKRQPFTGLEVIVRGKQAEEWPREYTDIVVEYVVRGQGVTRKAVERAIHLSETRYCPVMNSLKARISSSFRIVEE
jgi:putative redox protein